MARRAVFVKAEETHLLEEAQRWREQCVMALTRANPQGPLHKAVAQVVDTIDGVAEVGAGDRKRFHQISPRTPRPDLPPGKWRTVA